jgi:hypothetical protein
MGSLLEEGKKEDLLALCDASEQKFAPHLLFLRLPQMSSYRLEPSGSLVLTPSASTLDGQSRGNGTTTFVGRRQTDLEGSMEATFTFTDKRQVEAGLTVFLDATHHFDLALSPSSVSLRSTASPPSQSQPISSATTLHQIKCITSTYVFSFRGHDEDEWKEVGSAAAKDVSGGFTGVVLGVWASGDVRGRVEVTDWTYSSRRKW